MSKPGRVLHTMQRLRPSPATENPAAVKPKKARKKKAGNGGNGQAQARPPEAPAARAPQAEAPQAEPGRKAAPAPPADARPPPAVDIEAFSRNIARMVEQGGRALAAYLKPREEGRAGQESADVVADAVKTLGHVMQYWMADPQRALQIRT